MHEHITANPASHSVACVVTMTDENDSRSPREIQLKESSNPSPRVKPAPTEKGIGVPFVYNPSDDGTDENLLILLHGLGGYTAFCT